MLPISASVPSQLCPGTAQPPPPTGFPHPLWALTLLAQLGPPWSESTALAKRLWKGECEKTSRKRAKRPAPKSFSRSARRWEGGLPERAAISHPAITKKNLMPGAISDRYTRPPAGKVILGPGSGHGCWVPLTPALSFADLVCVFLFARECSLHACGQAQPASVSHISVLYLWFWSPGSQAGRESPVPLLRAHQARRDPKSHGETHTHTHTHTHLKERGRGRACLISGDLTQSRCPVTTVGKVNEGPTVCPTPWSPALTGLTPKGYLVLGCSGGWGEG